MEETLKNNETSQLGIGGVMWRCSRQFRMKDTKEVCFKNGGMYEQVKEQPLTLKDEDGIVHELAPNWIKWFHNAPQLTDKRNTLHHETTQ